MTVKAVKIKCPHCHREVRILREFRGVNCTVPVIEESTGFAGLDWSDMDVDVDSEENNPRYICENCGKQVFTNICEIDEVIREEQEDDALSAL